MIEAFIDRFLRLLFRYTEKAALVLVGGLALLAIGQTLSEIPRHGEIRLEDILLIFIYIEIMAMANVYFVRHSVPFTYPMFIAVTALARLIVLQGKEIDPANLLYEGAAIVLVSIGILIIRFSHRFGDNECDPPPPKPQDTDEHPKDQAPQAVVAGLRTDAAGDLPPVAAPLPDQPVTRR